MFVPVEEDVGIGWNVEHGLDGENREHGHVDLGGGLGVVQHCGVLLPVASYEPPANNRAVDHHHDPTEREEQHQGRVFIAGTILLRRKIYLKYPIMFNLILFKNVSRQERGIIRGSSKNIKHITRHESLLISFVNEPFKLVKHLTSF